MPILPLFHFPPSTLKTRFVILERQARSLNATLEFSESLGSTHSLGRVIRPLCGKQEGMQKHVSLQLMDNEWAQVSPSGDGQRESPGKSVPLHGKEGGRLAPHGLLHKRWCLSWQCQNGFNVLDNHSCVYVQ